MYDDVRDALLLKLRSVPGLGQVFPHARLSTDLERFLALYTVPNPADPTTRVLSVAWFTRVNQQESASWSEDLQIAAVTATSDWRIIFLYGFYDDDDPEAASDTHFQRTVDKILEVFRLDSTLGGADVLRSYPATLIAATTGTLETGNVMLAHRAEFTVRVENYITE
jgi:hypothetical protein